MSMCSPQPDAQRARDEKGKEGQRIRPPVTAALEFTNRALRTTELVAEQIDLCLQLSDFVSHRCPPLFSNYCRTNSTRRFRARPASVSFVSFGRDAPKPVVVSRAGSIL